MNINNSQFLSIEQLQDQYLKQQKVNSGNKSSQGMSFEEILQKQQIQGTSAKEAVKFSKHAANRLNDRKIELTEKQLERLNDGTKKAGQKGIRDSLVLVDQLAFIVNTKSNTVITAMDQTEADENIYTNIDGAVII
ncbi:MAG: flagellar protein [Lachnospiraceae bacterium]|jgi:flagellar operon protein|nr:flagellar protein [Lachnospiraceae bacterium]HBV84704.1 flagellar protein [Lachnospiraceae bacterium]